MIHLQGQYQCIEYSENVKAIRNATRCSWSSGFPFKDVNYVLGYVVDNLKIPYRMPKNYMEVFKLLYLYCSNFAPDVRPGRLVPGWPNRPGIIATPQVAPNWQLTFSLIQFSSSVWARCGNKAKEVVFMLK